MFAALISRLSPAVTGVLRHGHFAHAAPVDAVGSATSAAGQRGISTLMLALIGLLAGSSLAVPAMQLAAGTLASVPVIENADIAVSVGMHALSRALTR